MSKTWASIVSIGCLVRGLPLFFRASPRTPLRVLGIAALDTLHVLRHSRPLPRTRVSELAMFMDLAGYANATWDHKKQCESDYAGIRQRLEKAGLGTRVEAHLGRLREIEGGRPSIGGDRRRFDEARVYREGVVRLSIETAAAIALNANNRRLEARTDLRAVHIDHDVDTLFRILMQCQIIDDVLDYAKDLSAGLPSFLTASVSLPQSLELTRDAAREYATCTRSSGGSVFPLRIALGVTSAMAKLVVLAADWRHRHARLFTSAPAQTIR